MARVCMRPGCDRPAEVRLSYDTVSCQVWLDPVPEALGPVQEICEFHALRLTVPRGWELRDRRVASPPVVVPVELPTPVDNVDVEPTRVPLTVGASTPRVGRRPTGDSAPPIRRRHPDATASELFSNQVDDTPEVPTEDCSRSFDTDDGTQRNPDSEPDADPEVDAAADDAAVGSEPTSPLLARAFAQTGPQRSVLSDDLRTPDQRANGRNDR